MTTSKTSADKATAASIGKAVEQYNASNNGASTNVPTPSQLSTANLLDSKAFTPQDTSNTNHIGFCVTVLNGVATVEYSATATTSATAWGAALATREILYN